MKIIYKIMILILLIVLCSSAMCYARETLDGNNVIESEENAESGAGGSTGLPNLNNYKPTVQIGENAKSRVSIILGMLQVLGVIAVVIAIALIGFNFILGSASEKAVAQEKFIGIFVAGALMAGGSTIAKMIISIAENIV